MNINFFITDKTGSEFYIDCTFTVAPDIESDELDEDYLIEVETEFNIIEGVNEQGDTIQYTIDELDSDLQDEIYETIDTLTRNRF